MDGLPHSLRALMERIGVTRVARVTGLDRAGVEVACAVRPRGHVLQVSNGKGESFAEAAKGAVLEAAELFASERLEAARLVFLTSSEARARGAAIGPEELALADPRLAGARIAWEPARDLFGGGEVLVPACALRCPPAGAPLGPAPGRWTSNGMGAHPSREAALLHALCEAVERAELAAALPGGFTAREVERRLLDPATLPAGLRARVAAMASRGLAAHLFDLAPGRPIGLPVAGALLVDLEGGPVPVSAGYACALTPEAALRGALFEAAQSRLTDIHGAREDVAAMDAHEARALAGSCARARPRRSAAGMAAVRGGVPAVLRRLARAGHGRGAVAGLAPAGLGVHVVKVVIPSLALSELL